MASAIEPDTSVEPIQVKSLKLWPKQKKLVEYFNKPFTLGEHILALRQACGMTVAIPDLPHYELRQSLVSLALKLDNSKHNCPVIFQDDEQTRAVVLDIRSIRAQKDGTPLIEVQYLVDEKGPEGPLKLKTVQALLRETKGREAVMVNATVEEQKFLIKELESNSKKGTYILREPAYTDMKSSYLVVVEIEKETVEDIMKRMFPKPDKICAVCGAPAPKSCGNCKSAHYCGKDCQKYHWKQGGHKQVCENSLSAAAEGFHSDSNSVVVSLGPPSDDDPASSMYRLNISGITGKIDYHKPTHKIPRNIHGDNLFIVKIQAPLLRDAGQLMMYDEGKSFNKLIPESASAYPALHKVIMENVSIHKGMNKIYFNAKREAQNVRVFLDNLPNQSQPW